MPHEEYNPLQDALTELEGFQGKVEDGVDGVHHTRWIASFNNKVGVITQTASGATFEQNFPENLIPEVDKIIKEIIDEGSSIRDRVESGGEDASSEEKSSLFQKVESLKALLLKVQK